MADTFSAKVVGTESAWPDRRNVMHSLNLFGVVSVVAGGLFVLFFAIFDKRGRRIYGSRSSRTVAWVLLAAIFAITGWLGFDYLRTAWHGGSITATQVFMTVGLFLMTLGWLILLIRQEPVGRPTESPARHQDGPIRAANTVKI